MSEMRDADKRHPDGSWTHCAAAGPAAANGSPVLCAEVVGHDGDHLNGTYRWARRPILATLRLTEFQATEVQHGIEVDDADGNPEWGAVFKQPPTATIRSTRGSGPGWLDVYDYDLAIWRVTSSRDILRDNADDGFADATERRRYRDQAARLQKVVDQLVDAAGGPDKLTPDTRRYL